MVADEPEPELTIEAFVEYCRLQARLLSGTVETIETEASELLDELDEQTAEIRRRLDDAGAPAGPNSPRSTDSPTDPSADVDSLAELERDIEEKQTLVEAKRVRMEAFRELADAYLELADQLEGDAEDGRGALERVVRFEADHDAPAYFEDRETVLETAAARDRTE